MFIGGAPHAIGRNRQSAISNGLRKSKIVNSSDSPIDNPQFAPRRSTSKISRLPASIRNSLNQMIEDGLPYEEIIVKITDLGYEGITHQNLPLASLLDEIQLAAALRAAALSHCLSAWRHKPNFKALVHCGRNPLQHRQRVPFVVSVFQAGDHRLRRSHEFGQLLLRQLRFAANVMDELCDLRIGHRLVGQLAQMAVLPNHPIQNLQGIRGLPGFLFNLRLFCHWAI